MNLSEEELIAKFQRCLDAEGPYTSDEEKLTCRNMVEEMPEDLVVHAANTSYAYWYLSTQQSELVLSEETKLQMAMREGRRHLSYNSGNYETALKGLTEMCEWRRNEKIDNLRLCFDSDEDDADLTDLANLIRDDMKLQYVVMRGKDTSNRSIMIKYPRMKTGTTEKGYVLSQLYMAERSVAATEFLSEGREERSLAVFDFNGFESKNSPPFAMQISAATLVQKNYPERLQTLVLVSPAFWLRTLLNMITPVLSASITERIKHATGIEEKEPLFSAMMDVENATPLLLKDGKLDTPMSLTHFLETVPFYCLYDDVKCEIPVTDEEQAMHDTMLQSIKDDIEKAAAGSQSYLRSMSSSIGSVASSTGSWFG